MNVSKNTENTKKFLGWCKNQVARFGHGFAKHSIDHSHDMFIALWPVIFDHSIFLVVFLAGGLIIIFGIQVIAKMNGIGGDDA